MSFAADTAIRPRGPGTIEVEVPGTWGLGTDTTNGGYLAAVITRALEATVADPERRPRSLTVHYLAGCRPGLARVEVTVERSGRTLTALSARLAQGERTVALALAVLAANRPGLEYHHAPMPEAPPPESIEDWAFAPRPDWFGGNWEYRPCLGGAPFSGAREALTGGWVRSAPPEPLSTPMLAAIADCWLPPVLTLVDKPLRLVPTIDLTVHFRAAAAVPAGAYCFVQFDSKVGAEGYWESNGTVWSPEGEVLAQARQLALFDLRGR